MFPFDPTSKQAVDNALAAKEAGMTPTLPSCFVDTTPVTKEQVMPKLEALAGFASVALPQAVATPSCTACTPYMSEANSANADAGRTTSPTLAQAPDHPTVAGLTVAQSFTAGTAYVQPSDTQAPGASVTVSQLLSSKTDSTPGYDSLTDYQEQEQNILKLAQMVKSISKPMPKPQPQQPEPTNHFEKMRAWLQCDEPALRNEAIAWLKRCQDVEPVFDEYGNPYDFQEIEF